MAPTEHDIVGPETPPADALRRRLPILNRRGLHARASAKLVKLVETFEARVWVSREGTSVPGHSIMGLMMLAAAPGTEIDVAATGPDAEKALDAIACLVGNRFEEDE